MRIEPEDDRTLVDRVAAAFGALGREVRRWDDQTVERIVRIPVRLIQIIGMSVGAWIVYQAALQLVPATFQRVADQIPWPWVLLIGGVLLVIDSVMSWRALTPGPTASGPFSRRWVLIGCAVAIAATWAATTWMWSVATPGQRLDAIKAGLTVGAGTGGVFALLLAARRQWHQERQHAHDAYVARLTVDDATERRVTEAYNEALKQLSSDQTIVRQGAMFELERIADTYSDRQTTIAQLLCSYLRQPIPRPVSGAEPEDSSAPPPGWEDAADERIVGFDIVCKHLPYWDFRDPEREMAVVGRWGADELKLSGAHLPGVKISNSRLVDASFANTHIWDEIRFFRCDLTGVTFNGAEFHGSVIFDECVLCSVTFKKARFYGLVLIGTSSLEYVKFDGAQFCGKTAMGHTTLKAGVSFQDVEADPVLNLRGMQVAPDAYDIHIPGWVINNDRRPAMLEPEDPSSDDFGNPYRKT